MHSEVVTVGVNLSPAFSSETLNYTASVVNGVGATTIKATVPTGARLDPVAAEAPTRDTRWTLEVGPNTINLAVTAGDATTFYKIVITRGAAAADATLSALAFGDDVTLVPEFSRHTYRSYTATVPNSDMERMSHIPLTPMRPPTGIVYRVGTGQASNS